MIRQPAWHLAYAEVHHSRTPNLRHLLWQDELPHADEDARARDAMYERAESLAAVLTRLGVQLRGALDNINDAAYAAQVSSRAGPSLVHGQLCSLPSRPTCAE